MTSALLEALDRVTEAGRKVSRERALAPLRRQLQAAAAKHFRRQGTLFLAGFVRFKSQFTEADTSDDWEALYDQASSETAEDLATAIDDAVSAAFGAGADAAYAALNIEGAFDLANPRAVAYLDGYGARQVTKIDDTTRDALRSLISQAVEQGQSYGELAKEIRRRFDGFSRDRALVVATYETGMAYEAGNRAGAAILRDAGVALEKSWKTVGDGRVDPHCSSNAGAGWIAFDQPFPSGDMHPLSHPRCRCVCLYQRKVR